MLLPYYTDWPSPYRLRPVGKGGRDLNVLSTGSGSSDQDTKVIAGGVAGTFVLLVIVVLVLAAGVYGSSRSTKILLWRLKEPERE